MKKFLLLFIIYAAIILPAASQNVGIGTSSPKGKLEIEATNEGIVIPRVALTALNSATPLTSPEVSELVYNTATAGTAPNNVTPGFYYWNGSSWVRLQSGSANITASNGLTLASNDVKLGGSLTANTTIAQGANKLIFTNNTIDAFRVNDTTFSIDGLNQRVGIGTNAPAHILHLVESGNDPNISGLYIKESNIGQAITIEEDGNGHGILVQSKGNGGSIYATSEGAVTTDRFGSIFIDSTTSTTANITKIGSFIRSIGRWSGTNATNTGLVVEAKGDVTNLTPTIVGLSVSVDNATNKYAAIFSGGNVGIGVGTPQRLLHLSKDNNFGHVNTNTSLFRLQNANNTTCPGTVNIWDVRVGNCGQLGFITSSSNVNPNFNILKANDLIADAPGVVASINTTAPVNTFMIDADGDVGINNAAPAHKLDVGGDINISSGFGVRINGTATSGQFLRGNGTRFVSAAITAADIPDLDASKITSGTLPVSRGGTGATTAPSARTNLGLGTMATQNADAVAITGGTVFASGNSGVGTTSAFNANVRFSIDGGLLQHRVNSQNYPLYDAFGGWAAGWNFTAGGAEVDFWNVYNGAATPKGFVFRQQTGASSQKELMRIKAEETQLAVNGGIRGGYRLINGVDATLNAADYYVHVGGGGNITITFPLAATAGAGATLYFRTQFAGGTKTFQDGNANAQEIRLLGAATLSDSFTIVGGTNSHRGMIFISDGAVWNQISNDID